MKPHAAWFTVSSFAAVLMAGMLVVMWAQRPSSACTLSPEAPRRLVLGREVDREHLSADLASVDRVARRYTASTHIDDQDARFLACETLLIQEVATRHGVPLEHLRRGGQ